MKRLNNFWFKLLLGVVLLGFLFWRVDYRGLFHLLAAGRLLVLAVALVLLAANESSRIIRLHLLLKVKGLIYPPRRLAKIYFMSMFFGNFAPSSLGSDVARFLFLRRDAADTSPAAVAAVILADRIIGLLGLGFLFLVGLILAGARVVDLLAVLGHSISLPTGWLVLGFSVGLAALAVLWFWFRERLRRVFAETKVFFSQPKICLQSFFWSVLYQLLISIVFYLIYLGLTQTALITLAEFILWVPIITLISLLPLSVGGLGLREWSFVFLFAATAAPATELIATSLTFFVFMLVQSAIGGAVFLTNKGN